MTSLKAKKIYIEDTDRKLIYQLESATMDSYEGCELIELEFILVAGWDYINPDYSDVQGWTTPDKFVEDVQEFSINQYYLQESAKECIEANGYIIIEALPSIR